MSAEILDFAEKRSRSNSDCGLERGKSKKGVLAAARAEAATVWELADLYQPIGILNLAVAPLHGP